MPPVGRGVGVRCWRWRWRWRCRCRCRRSRVWVIARALSMGVLLLAPPAWRSPPGARPGREDGPAGPDFGPSGPRDGL